MENFFNALLKMSISASFMIVAVIVIRLIFKNAPKYIRCIMWGLTAIRLALPFSVESSLSLIPRLPAVNASGAAQNAGSTYIAASAPTSFSIEGGFASVLPVIWLSGFTILILYMPISFVLLRKRVSESVEAEDGIRVCDRVGSPFILGIFHPVIYLSSSIGENDKKYVIAHERAHIRRLDNLWKPLGYLLMCVHWFNPLCMIAFVLFCRDIELACDEKAVKSYDEKERKAYANALLMCSTRRYKVSVCPVAFAEVNIKQRVKNVLRCKKSPFLLICISIAVCALVAVCFMTNPVSGYSDSTAKNNTFTDNISNTVSISAEPTLPKQEKPTEKATMPATEKPTEKPTDPQTYDYETESEDDYYSYEYDSSGGGNYDDNNGNEPESYDSDNGSNYSRHLEITPFDSSAIVEEYADIYDNPDYSLISDADNSDDAVQRIKWDLAAP